VKYKSAVFSLEFVYSPVEADKALMDTLLLNGLHAITFDQISAQTRGQDCTKHHLKVSTLHTLLGWSYRAKSPFKIRA